MTVALIADLEVVIVIETLVLVPVLIATITRAEVALIAEVSIAGIGIAVP